MMAPNAGEIKACTAPYAATRIETANAARAPPKVSSGSVYMLTLKAATVPIASEIPAADKSGVGSHGIAAVARESTAATPQARVRAATAVNPRAIQESDSHPPAKPPIAAKANGIHA